MANRHGNGEEGSTLVFDDLGTGFLNEFLDLFVVTIPLDAVLIGGTVTVGIYMVVCDVGQRPGNELTVAVFAVDMGMDILGADMEALCQRGLQTAGVQNGAGADDLILGNAGDLVEHIGQNINRIGNDDINGIGSIFGDILSNTLQNADIGLCQIQTSHTGFSGNSAGDHNDVGVCGILIITGANDCGGAERGTLIYIKCFTDSLLLVDIHKNDFRGHALNH